MFAKYSITLLSSVKRPSSRFIKITPKSHYVERTIKYNEQNLSNFFLGSFVCHDVFLHSLRKKHEVNTELHQHPSGKDANRQDIRHLIAEYPRGS